MTPRTAEACYREVALVTDVLSARGPALTAILYGELLDTLRIATHPQRVRVAGARALGILGELEGTIGAEESRFATLMRAIHRHATTLVVAACRENDPKRIHMAIEAIAPIAEAWSSLRARS